MPVRRIGARGRADGRFPRALEGNSPVMVGILIAAVLAALTFAVCTALGLPAAVGILFSVVVLVGSVPTVGNRFGASDLSRSEQFQHERVAARAGWLLRACL